MAPTRRTLLAAGFGSLSVVLAHAEAIPAAWPGGAKAAVSLTYDDGLDSQLANAVPALNVRGLKATFFLTEENMAARVKDWQAVAAEGHEIGNHTVSHPCELRNVSVARMTREVDQAEAFLDAHFAGAHQREFAYPCGVIDLGRGPQLQTELRYIDILRGQVVAARATDGGPNDPRLVGRDRYVLRADAATYDRDDPWLAIDYVRSAIRHGFWAVLIFHDILPKRLGDGDTSIAHHDLILDWIVHQPLWCVPMRDVLRHLKVESA